MRRGVRLGLAIVAVAASSGCAARQGTDVDCIRQKLGGVDSVSMAVAAKICGHVVDGRLTPLDLHGAPELQVEARHSGVAYTP
ncbi:hypothetical protein FHR90_002286 [Endobacter medicaginis]|jgi:hypothetical protein|uniref:Lipoprotein n=1 Tax=Endobacter medicaginis TaxID=1181271 RepID=A0A839V0T2_9PROT|nr:hypothetical protein [Endobacter medicaginis]MBB3174445.1 hypothetical protein [Endobacter medicaginis]MCX5475105.1 hypothetical protein [Endobacter medicaginis]